MSSPETLFEFTSGEGTIGTRVTRHIGWVLDHPEDAQIIFLYLDCGYSLREVGERVYRCMSSVQWRLKRLGIPRRSVGGNQTTKAMRDRRAVTIALYVDQGMSLSEVARVMNRHKTGVRATLLNAGIKLRSRKEGTRMMVAKLNAKQRSERGKKAYQNRSEEAKRRFAEMGTAARQQQREAQAA
jgi:predicted DNA-binding protein YlxM (UPF0122 family)